MARTYSVLHHMMTLQAASQAAVNLQDDIEDLERAKSDQPERDHTAALALLTSSFQSLRATISKSTFPSDHQLRQGIKRFKNHLSTLSSEEKKEPLPPVIAAAPPPVRVKAVQLPKITLPSFDGDLMNWMSFWSQFSAAVDSNVDLTKLNKLAYLRDAGKGPTTRSLLFSGAERDGMYDEVIALLHERFDRRREVHAIYCKELINIGQVKSTKAELTQFADTLTRTISGLKHTGQYDLDSVLTSLLVPSLSKALQIKWEMLSKD